MKNKNYVWVVKNNKNEIVKRVSCETGKLVDAVYYGKLIEVAGMITYKEWKEMETLEIYNNSYDNVSHKPITKEQIEKILDEVK